MRLGRLGLENVSSSFRTVADLPMRGHPSLRITVSGVISTRIRSEQSQGATVCLGVDELECATLLRSIVYKASHGFAGSSLTTVTSYTFVHERRGLLVRKGYNYKGSFLTYTLKERTYVLNCEALCLGVGDFIRGITLDGLSKSCLEVVAGLRGCSLLV